MTRIGRLVLGLPLILAAAPVHRGPFPVPPIPPALPSGGEPAPTPDQNAAAPAAPVSDGVRITPRLLQAPTFHNSYDPSQGYLSGSRWQDDPAEDRRLTPSPGFNVVIPFK
jgi:hypothetical protein